MNFPAGPSNDYDCPYDRRVPTVPNHLRGFRTCKPCLEATPVPTAVNYL